MMQVPQERFESMDPPFSTLDDLHTVNLMYNVICIPLSDIFLSANIGFSFGEDADKMSQTVLAKLLLLMHDRMMENMLT